MLFETGAMFRRSHGDLLSEGKRRPALRAPGLQTELLGDLPPVVLGHLQAAAEAAGF